ncbi:MAG TPA: Ig-like domain-containing protein [Gemmatimonadales bacterium]|nr:Ig-like domain-containing protein [Gemmatimonadales bacterium]
MSRRAGVLALALLFGCGGGGTDPNPDPGPGPDPDPAPVAAVRVTPDNQLVVVDDSGQLAAQVTDSDGTVLTDRLVTWSSLDDTLVAVSGTGQVSALSYGDARIVATSEEKSDTVIVRSRLRFTRISASGDLTCGLLASGAAWCWGRNDNGGLGARLDSTSSRVPVRVADGHRFTAIAVGGQHACGLDQDLAAWCWGDNEFGELGDGVPSNGVSFPSRVVGNHRFLAITAASGTTCALDESRLAYCWGSADQGRIPGQGSETVNFPFALAPPPDAPQALTFASIQSGGLGTCGIATEIDRGELWCWGDNSRGQILEPSAPVYTQIDSPLIPFTVGVGPGFTCYTGVDNATRQTPIAQCRGLDIGVADIVFGIRDYPSIAGAVALDAGGDFACALLEGGALRCWGGNDGGQLGIGATTDVIAVPVGPDGGHTWAAMDVGNEMVCGIATDGITYCWGRNENAQLGDGTMDNRNVPTAVAGQL